MNKENIIDSDTSICDEEENQVEDSCNCDKEQDSTNENTASNEELEKLKKDLQMQRDLLLRTAAEYENFRKRSEKEKAAIYSDATARAITAILPIADSLERASESLKGSSPEYIKGIELIINQFNESLKKLSVESFGEKGEQFSPDIHNAVSHIDSEELEENVIAEVFQKGYKIGDRIVRHAMVQVAN